MTTLPAERPWHQPLSSEQARALRFPPIPEPPAGVDIVSFEAFVPSGINVPVDEADDMIEPDEDYEEFDALGVATLALPSHKKDHHSLANRLKKRKAPKNKDTSTRSTWWEVWDETESVRRKIYDQRLPPAERLSIAAEDFREDRPWPPAATGIANFWDQFRMYIGLLAHPKNPNQKGGDEDGAEDPEPENMGEPVSEPQQQRGMEVKVTFGSSKKPKLRRPFDPDDPKTERFLDDPETNVKIFLSSYFSKKGLLWSRGRRLAFPILLRFFMSYLIRCKTFSESDINASLRRAVDIAKRAEIELPKTGEIAMSLPNDVAGAFVALWGSHLESDVQDPAIAQDITAQELVHEERRRAVEDERERIEKEVARWKQEEAQVKEEERREKAEEARLAIERASELQEQLAGPDADAVAENDLEIDGADDVSDDVAADTSGDDGPVSGGESGAWPSPGAERGVWGGDDSDVDEEDEVDEWAVALPTLLSTLGPTALPLTHRAGIVERSTRRIKEIISPATRRPCKKASDPAPEAVEEDLATHFARVVLEPWPLDNLSAHSQIEHPSILASSHGKVDLGNAPSPGVEGHSPFRDTITVLLDRRAVGMLENAIGMGLGATWTQIKRAEVTGKKGKGKSTSSFWYMEGLFHQIPSFWTDDVNEVEDDEDDEDEYAD
ncbi:hypothetical protein PENSPDRAFT_757170 [Peniophora sp. CONT]|nr:hypothetical protein PENSPDRAFT_757170 [Peniophora sp. CONT]